MLRPEITAEGLHERQAAYLPGRFTECRADHLGRTTHVWSATVFGPDDRRLALFRCTQMILW